MRTLLATAAVLLLLSPLASAQRGGGRGGAGGGRAAAPPAAPINPGFECFATVEKPAYPPAALQARVDGTSWISIMVSAQGAVEKIDSKMTSAWGTADKLLTPAVEKAVRASKFKPECNGKTVDVVYRYELHGDPVASPKPMTRMDAPNIMYIESQPGMRVPAVAK